jgi:glycosyltransferase involved in cell wall biosynthesis
VPARLALVRILHYFSGLDWSGAARSGALLARGLTERGHRCRVLSGADGPQAADLRRLNVPVTVLPPPRHRFDRTRRRALLEAFDRERPDLLHINNLSREAPSIAAAAARRSVPIAWHVREDPASSRALRLRRPLLRRARVVIAVSRQIRDAWAAAARPGQIVAIPNGIEPGPPPDAAAARAASGLEPGRPWVGWLGRVVRRKGALDLLQACATVAAAGDGRDGAGKAPGGAADLRVLLAGRPSADRREAEYLTEVERLMRREPRLRGRVLRVEDPQTRPRLIEGLDILAVPSYWEGCSRVVLEGMRDGRAIVAYASGGTPELLQNEESGLLVATGDVAALAAAIGRLLRDPGLAVRIGAAARRRVTSEFTLDRHVQRVEAVFRDLA